MTAVSDGHRSKSQHCSDVSADGRRTTVAFTDDWKEDAARRTSQSTLRPIGRELFDYFSGLDDLGHHLVRFIGDPLQRIAEDHLPCDSSGFTRVLDWGTRQISARACTLRADLMALRERIADELLKLLGMSDPSRTVAIMLDRRSCDPSCPRSKLRLSALKVLVAAERKPVSSRTR